MELGASLLADSALRNAGLATSFDRMSQGPASCDDVPPRLSSEAVWSPILNEKEIGREEALFRRADHRLPTRS